MRLQRLIEREGVAGGRDGGAPSLGGSLQRLIEREGVAGAERIAATLAGHCLQRLIEREGVAGVLSCRLYSGGRHLQRLIKREGVAGDAHRTGLAHRRAPATPDREKRCGGAAKLVRSHLSYNVNGAGMDLASGSVPAGNQELLAETEPQEETPNGVS